MRGLHPAQPERALSLLRETVDKLKLYTGQAPSGHLVLVLDKVSNDGAMQFYHRDEQMAASGQHSCIVPEAAAAWILFPEKQVERIVMKYPNLVSIPGLAQ